MHTVTSYFPGIIIMVVHSLFEDNPLNHPNFSLLFMFLSESILSFFLLLSYHNNCARFLHISMLRNNSLISSSELILLPLHIPDMDSPHPIVLPCTPTPEILSSDKTHSSNHNPDTSLL